MADLELVAQLASATHLAVLATTRPDGTVHASLVSAGLFDDPVDGGAAVAAVIRGDAKKLAYLRRAGRAAAVFTRGFEWVSVEGPVRVIGPDDPDVRFSASAVPDLLRRVFVAAGGSHDDWEEYDRVMATERRAAVFVHAARISSNG